jgi:hypothetical protein
MGEANRTGERQSGGAEDRRQRLARAIAPAAYLDRAAKAREKSCREIRSNVTLQPQSNDCEATIGDSGASHITIAWPASDRRPARSRNVGGLSASYSTTRVPLVS